MNFYPSLYFFQVFVSKVGITEFPENFTRGTPRPKGSEIKRIFNLGAQNGRYYYNSNSELLGELAFSRIFIVRFHGFSCFFINFKFSGGLLIFDETNEMHRKDQVFVRPLRWTKVFYEA